MPRPPAQAIPTPPELEDWVMGLGGSDHDFSAALMYGTDVRVAIEAERITRIKYGVPKWFEDPFTACTDYCLAAASIPATTPRRTVSSDLLPYRILDSRRIKAYPHHLCHAASAAMLLNPATRACVLVYDGAGSVEPLPSDAGAPRGEADMEVFSFYDLVDGRLKPLGATKGRRRIDPLQLFDGGTNSIGLLYDLITSILGFHRLEAGKTMGLAGWGEPRFVEEFMDFMSFGSSMDDVFSFDPFDPSFHELLQKHLSDAKHSFSVRADLAASVQEILTRCLLHCYGLIDDRDFDVFCIAGGCALNTVANGVLANKVAAHRQLLIPPHAGDTGIGLGALWLDVCDRSMEPFQMTVRGEPLMPAIGRPGQVYPASVVRRASRRDPNRIAEDPAISGPEALADVLAAGKIVGVFNGPSEIGPRALGGRSILADPRSAELKERINRIIKHREPFRPLAPIVLAEHYDELFSPPAAANPFMLVVARANDDCRRLAPAVVHVDDTARVQVVSPGGDPFLICLLAAFRSLTGLPLLLNTSFNRRGEPIVETPDDAVAAFLDMGLDGLWLQDIFLYPPPGRPAGI